eukprot:9716582-Prorocentrum_lima.AAC.1
MLRFHVGGVRRGRGNEGGGLTVLGAICARGHPLLMACVECQLARTTQIPLPLPRSVDVPAR